MRILLVEDDPDIGASLKKALTQLCYVVDLETDGDRGYQLARENDYDLLILDNMLPGLHGDEICRALRESGRTVPIIMLSVQGDVRKKVDLLQTGADDYVTKPFSLEELTARIEAVMRRSPGLVDAVLQVEDLVLDRASFKARRGERSIYLTVKEYELLEYFMRNRGRVLTRGMIMEHVWDRSADMFSHTIETHVMRLRQKIEQDAAIKLIHTVPGRGYKLDPVS